VSHPADEVHAAGRAGPTVYRPLRDGARVAPAGRTATAEPLAVLALVLVVPAELAEAMLRSSTNSVAKPPGVANGNTTGQPVGGFPPDTSGVPTISSTNPEPASLALAVIGSGAAALAALARRRRRGPAAV
jgi:hypothetical protein